MWSLRCTIAAGLKWMQVLNDLRSQASTCIRSGAGPQASSPAAPVQAFEAWCHEAAAAGVRRVLLVTGPKGPRHDAVARRQS